LRLSEPGLYTTLINELDKQRKTVYQTDYVQENTTQCMTRAQAVSRAFPSNTRSILAEIYLRRTCVCHETKVTMESVRTGRLLQGVSGAEMLRGDATRGAAGSGAGATATATCPTVCAVHAATGGGGD
jgi:hypothetical protein